MILFQKKKKTLIDLKMNSKELWNKLYEMETKEIKIQATMMIMYLVKDRQVDLKYFIRDLKKIYKEIGE